jgi:hypothetical protein
MTCICTRYLLRRQVIVEGNILETLQLKKLVFPIARPDAQMTESGCLAQKVKIF